MAMNFKNEKGFTLLEALIALMMSSAILLLLTSGLLQARTINSHFIEDSQLYRETSDTVMGNRQIEWHLFLNQLEGYLQGTKNPVTIGRHLSVDEFDEKLNDWILVEYRQPYQGSTRNIHQFKNNGNVRLLTGVELPNFHREGGWLHLDFKFRNGERYKGRIWVESWVKEEIKVD